MSRFGLKKGLIWTDQGGELARSGAFCNMMLDDFGTWLNQLVLTAPHRMVVQKYTTIPIRVWTLLYKSGFPQNFGLWLFFMLSIFIIGSSTLPSTQLPTRLGTVENRTSHILRHSVLWFASNVQAHNDVSLIATISPEFFLLYRNGPKHHVS
jgi:hypothetical protein